MILNNHQWTYPSYIYEDLFLNITNFDFQKTLWLSKLNNLIISFSRKKKLLAIAGPSSVT